MLAIRFSLATMLLLIASAYGRPPENADPTLAPWFQSLSIPGTGISCCSIADCRPTVVCWTPERGVMCFVRGTEA